ELPHEALIRHWGSLRHWVEIEAQREDLRFRRRLQETVEAWEQAGRLRGSLWRPPDLDLLQRYAERNNGGLTALQDEFLSASERQTAWERTLTRIAIAAIITLAVVAGGLALISWNRATDANAQRLIAEQQRKDADAQRSRVLFATDAIGRIAASTSGETFRLL